MAKSVLLKEYGYTYKRSGNWVVKKTTCGWSFLVTWKDGCSSWAPIEDLKVFNLIEVSEYAQVQNL